MISKANNELRIWFELAEKLGIPVAELQARMSAEEFTYWVAFWKVRNGEQEEARKKAELEYRAKNVRRGM